MKLGFDKFVCKKVYVRAVWEPASTTSKTSRDRAEETV